MKPGQRIVWELPDGTLLVGKYLGGDPLAFLRKVEAGPALQGARRLPDPTPQQPLPPRRWRACWRHDGQGAVRVHLPLARAQRLHEIRLERDRRLAASDGVWMRELERMRAGGDAALLQALEAYRQALRDLPARLEAAAALEALADAQALADFAPDWPALPGAQA
jgi:Phage tail assembly chaperone protein